MTARFVASASSWDQLPVLGLPEVAFAGRSNVGKSTLLGMLLAAPKLVRTSRTPGQTRTLNLFVFDETLALVDLPGYGFAKASKSDLAKLETTLRNYLAQRDVLSGVALVIDARRFPVSDYDQKMLRWLSDSGRPVLVLVTKIDHIGKNQRRHRLGEIERELGIPAGAAIACSGETGEGRKELMAALFALRQEGGS